MMNLPAGMKWVAIVAVVLAVILTSYFVIRYVQKATEASVTIELQEKTLEKRDTIKDAVENSVGSRTPSDATDSLQWFRDRQSSR